MMTAGDKTSRTEPAIAIRRALDELTAAVGAARALLSEGAACDLAGLDGRVEELCAALTALAPEAGQPYLPALLRLSEELGGLQADCERQRTDALRMEHAAARGRAAHAYGAARPPRGRPGGGAPPRGPRPAAARPPLTPRQEAPREMDLETYLQFGLALVFVLGLIGLLALVLRRLGYGGPALSRGRQRRLAVVEVAAIDAKRRLVLIRRDGAEHLLLLGASGDLVIERGIGASGDFRRDLDEADRTNGHAAPRPAQGGGA